MKQKNLKKINSYKRTTRIWEIIEEIIKIHKAIESQIDFNHKDKKLAVYIILGGMTSSLIRSTHALEYGEIERHAMLQRIIAEAMDLSIFFCEIEDNSRQIKAWFKGKIINREPGNPGNLTIEERAQLFNADKQAIENMEETSKIATRLLSCYVHPSYDLMTITADFKARSFRYYAQRQEKISAEELEAKARLGLSCLLTAFGMSLRTLFLLDSPQYINDIGAFMREIYPEAYID